MTNTNMNTKATMTITDHLMAYKNFASANGDTETVAWCDERIEMLNKRYSARSEKRKNAHIDFDSVVFDCISKESNPTTVSELINGHDELKDFSVSKVTPSLGRLVKLGKVFHAKVKGKSYYSV